MSILPDLRDELVAAAARPAPRSLVHRARRQRRTVMLAAAMTLALSGTAGAVLIAAGVVGGEPTTPVPEVRGEQASGMTRTRAARIVATATLPSSGPIEIVGYTMRGYGGRGELICVDVAMRDGTKAGGCDFGIPARAAGLLGTRVGGSPGPKLAVGATRAPASSVDVRFSVAGEQRVRRAEVLNVTEDSAQALGTSPFSYYVAELPAEAEQAVATARDEQGNQIWAHQFDG